MAKADINVAGLLRVPPLERERPQREKLMTAEQIVRGVFCLLALLSVAAIAFSTYWVNSHVIVPKLIGVPRLQAIAELESLSLSGAVVQERFSASPRGQIIAQTPAAGRRLRKGAVIELVVSNGIEGFIIPDVTGDDLSYARAELEYLGLTVTVLEESSDVEPGMVLSTDPVSGTPARRGDQILLRVATRVTGDTLIDFGLAGKRIAIEPRYTQTSAGDISFETARRLSSLFQAANATVTITRSSREKQVTASVFASRAAATSPDVFVVLSVSGADHEGIVVKGPSLEDNSVGQGTYERLRTHFPETTIFRKVDPFGPAAPALTVEVVLGSTASRNDVLQWGDGQWSDRVARALYMAGGGVLRPGTF